MDGTKRLSWGLLSTARINRAVIPPIRASKKSRLLAVASRSLDKAQEYARSWGIPRAYGSYDALLADPDIDVIYNSLPNSLHAAWSIKAMQMGKHVLCEKPLATCVSDVDQIIEISGKTGAVIAEAFMYRHHPQTLLVKKLIDQREIGQLQFVRGSFCYTNTRPGDLRYVPEMGGGSLWDIGCYPLSFARYLTGEEPVEVSGNQVTGDTGVDLLFAGQIRFPGGVIGQIVSSFISPFQVMVEITGETGRISIPEPYKPGKKTVVYIERHGKIKKIRVKGQELYLGEIEDIENAVLLGKPCLISLEDSRCNIMAIEALFKSAQTAKSVIISE